MLVMVWYDKLVAPLREIWKREKGLWDQVCAEVEAETLQQYPWEWRADEACRRVLLDEREGKTQHGRIKALRLALQARRDVMQQRAELLQRLSGNGPDGVAPANE